MKRHLFETSEEAPFGWCCINMYVEAFISTNHSSRVNVAMSSEEESCAGVA